MSIMLCGHLDVFPPPADMKTPYKAVFKNNCIYGAGIADMKAGTTAMVMAADAVLRSKIDLKGDIIVAAVREEEIGGVGINHLLRSGVTANMGIVPESTNLEISTTGAGIAKFRVSTLGKSVHVGNKEHGVDAIAKMAKVVEALAGMKFTYEPDPRAPKLPRYAAGTIIGGRGRNYDLRGAQNLSDYCTLLVNVRFWKSQSVNSVEEDLGKVLDDIAAEDSEFKYELMKGYGPGPFETAPITRNPKDVPLDSPIVEIVKENHRNVTGKHVKFRSTLNTVGNDDGANMNEAGIITVTYGPGPGSRKLGLYDRTPLAARWIEIDTIHTCSKVMALSAVDVCLKEKK
jgi:acetylornithine deacetylase